MSYFEDFDGFSLNKQTPAVPIYENRPSSPKVTLAIPTYKRVATLRYAILSAMAQDYKDFEIIVIDNNPERGDETEQYMLQYKDNERLSYYKNATNIGLFGNWNRCFEMAHGQWVTLLHDDDYYFPNYLSTMVSWLTAFPSIQGLYCNRHLWYDEKETESIDVVHLSPYKRHGISQTKNYMLFLSHPIGPVGIFFKRDNVIKMGGYNPNCYPIADYAFNWRYHLKYGIYYIDTILVHYRIGLNVSIKPETIIQQENKNLEIRREYMKKNELPLFLDGFSETTYNNNLAIAQAKNPNFDWGQSRRYKHNLYNIIWKFLLFWNNKIYRRYGAKSFPN